MLVGGVKSVKTIGVLHSYRQVHARQKLPSFPVKVFSVDSATWNYTIWNKLLGHPKISLKSNMVAKIQNGRQIT